MGGKAERSLTTAAGRVQRADGRSPLVASRIVSVLSPTLTLLFLPTPAPLSTPGDALSPPLQAERWSAPALFDLLSPQCCSYTAGPRSRMLRVAPVLTSPLSRCRSLLLALAAGEVNSVWFRRPCSGIISPPSTRVTSGSVHRVGILPGLRRRHFISLAVVVEVVGGALWRRSQGNGCPRRDLKVPEGNEAGWTTSTTAPEQDYLSVSQEPGLEPPLPLHYYSTLHTGAFLLLISVCALVLCRALFSTNWAVH